MRYELRYREKRLLALDLEINQKAVEAGGREMGGGGRRRWSRFRLVAAWSSVGGEEEGGIKMVVVRVVGTGFWGRLSRRWIMRGGAGGKGVENCWKRKNRAQLKKGTLGRGGRGKGAGDAKTNIAELERQGLGWGRVGGGGEQMGGNRCETSEERVGD